MDKDNTENTNIKRLVTDLLTLRYANYSYKMLHDTTYKEYRSVF